MNNSVEKIFDIETIDEVKKVGEESKSSESYKIIVDSVNEDKYDNSEENPNTEQISEEKVELTEEDIRALKIRSILNRIFRNHPKKHYGVKYQAKRRTKTKMQKQSRRQNR